WYGSLHSACDLRHRPRNLPLPDGAGDLAAGNLIGRPHPVGGSSCGRVVLWRWQDGVMREVLAAWGQPEVTGVLSGGNRNTVLDLRLGMRRLVARWSRRDP